MASGRNHKLIRKMFTEPMNQVRTRESDSQFYVSRGVFLDQCEDNPEKKLQNIQHSF